MTLDRFYLIDRIELVVAQAPAGQTSHQIWVGEASGALTKVREYIDALTVDDQTLSMPVDPPLAVDRVLILTTKSPSWIAWREVRVFGVPAPQPQAAIASKITVEKLLEWPRINLRGGLEMPIQITQRGRRQRPPLRGRAKGPYPDCQRWEIAFHSHSSIFQIRSPAGQRARSSQRLVFPPDYAEKRYFYVNYTERQNRIP